MRKIKCIKKVEDLKEGKIYYSDSDLNKQFIEIFNDKKGKKYLGSFKADYFIECGILYFLKKKFIFIMILPFSLLLIFLHIVCKNFSKIIKFFKNN